MIRALLAAAVLAVAGCGPKAVRSPEWILGDSHRFPSELYLVGIGSAPTSGGLPEALRAASAGARAELAQTIEVRVDHVQRLERQSHRSGQVDRRRTQLAVEAESSALSTYTETSTEQIVQGIELKEKYHDADRGVLYVLAVLDKQQAAQRLLNQLADLEEQTGSLLTGAAGRMASEDLLAAVRLHRQALNLALKSDVLLSQLRVIDPYAARDLDMVHGSATVAADLSKLLERYGFSVSMEGYPLLEAALREAMVGIGLDVRSRPQAGQAGLTLWGVVNVKRGTYPTLERGSDEALHVCRVYLGIKLVDDLTGSIVGQVNLLDNSNAETADLAEERALRLLRERIATELPASLYRALSMEAE